MADVSMDYGICEKMANIHGVSSDVLKGVSKALKIASDILKATAMFGMVGNLALAYYLDNIRPKVDQLAEDNAELKKDVLGAIAALRDGDNTGSQRFV
ncbi:MAG TPA: hypothetical protein PLD47_03575 [Aggregatilineales bacterium]|nr:hypothetical protein [Anaerolineales bacterium]HRE46780.1 hypothetical protein [Aggregatilineales bacterium]